MAGSLEATARNAPCHCGSGTKYKRCHGAGGALEAQATARDTRLPGAVALLGVVGGAVATVTLDNDWRLGLAIAGAGLVVALALFVFRDPPPPRKDAGNPAGLNFGL